MRTARNRCITILALLAVICAAGVGFAKAEPAFAAEPAALDVYYDDHCLKSFTMTELQTIAAQEGARKYTFSSFNTYPTPEQIDAAEGPTVTGILTAALRGSGQTIAQIGEDQLIEFRASDGVKETFLKGTLLTQPRYYYPRFKLEQGRSGQAVLPESMQDPAAVPAIISLREDGKSDGDSVGRLLFGQISPSEQNKSAFVRYLAKKDTETASKRGRITICSNAAKPAQSLQPIQTAETGPAGIVFDRSVNRSHTEGGSRYWICYTTDGSEPDLCSNMYNYNNYAFGEPGEKINYPPLPKVGQPPLRVKVFSYDRMDSAVTEFAFPGGASIGKLTCKKKTVTVTWKKAADADGYQIWRATKKTGKYQLVKTIPKGTAASWKNKGLKKGKTYYYKVRAYRSGSGTTGYGSYSAVKHIKVK